METKTKVIIAIGAAAAGVGAFFLIKKLFFKPAPTSSHPPVSLRVVPGKVATRAPLGALQAPVMMHADGYYNAARTVRVTNMGSTLYY